MSNRFAALFEGEEESASRPVERRPRREERRPREERPRREERRPRDERPRREERRPRDERPRGGFGGYGGVVRRAAPKPEPLMEVVKPSLEEESGKQAEAEGRKLTKRERQALNRAKKGQYFVLGVKSQKEVRKKAEHRSHETGRYSRKVTRRVGYKFEEESFVPLSEHVGSSSHGWSRPSSSWQETARVAAEKEAEAAAEESRLREAEIVRQREVLRDRLVVDALKKRGTVSQGMTRVVTGVYDSEESDEEDDGWRDHRGRRVVDDEDDEGECEYAEEEEYDEYDEDEEYNADLCVGTTAYNYSSHATGHGKRDKSAW